MIKAEYSFDSETKNPNEKWLIFGRNGWIGGKLIELLIKNNCNYYLADCRLEDRESILKLMDEYHPTRVLNAAGITGRPTVDWCETNQIDTIRSNVIGTLNLADICETRGIHCTMYATGCIFSYTDDKLIFDEGDECNFNGSFYSMTKGFVDNLLKDYSHVLTLRIRMPISDDFHPRNFLTKITNYENIYSVPNSMTVLFDMLPVSLVLANRGHTGIFNLTNPGIISHNECLGLHRDMVDAECEWNNIDDTQLMKYIKCERSNNQLNHEKLVSTLNDIHIPHIKESVEKATARRGKLSGIYFLN